MKKLIVLLLALLAAPAFAQNSPCYWSGSFVRCFPKSGIMLDTQRSLEFGDAGTNYVQIKAPSAVTTYTLVLPSSQGGVGTYLRNDGTGTLSWAAASGSGAAGTVTSVGTGAGLTGGPITSSGVISLATVGTAGTYWKVLTDAYGRVTSGTTISAADVPTLNQDTTGVAANVSGTVAIGHGGTGQTSASAAFNALSPLTTIGDLLYGGASGAGTRLAGPTAATKQYLTSTGDGVNAQAPTWSSIQAADVPTLNQNTTGTAANITGTLAVANGGTGIGAGTSGGVPYFSSTSTVASSAALTASQVVVGGGAGAAPATLAAGSQYQVLRMGASTPAYGAVQLNQSAAVTGSLAIANGGTGAGTASAAFDALSPMTTLGDVIYGGASGTNTRLAGNTSATKMFLTQTGTGSVSAAPSWGTLASADLPVVTNGSATTAVSTGTQTFAGAKTFSGAMTVSNTISITGAGNGLTTSNGDIIANSGQLKVNASGSFEADQGHVNFAGSNFVYGTQTNTGAHTCTNACAASRTNGICLAGFRADTFVSVGCSTTVTSSGASALNCLCASGT